MKDGTLAGNRVDLLHDGEECLPAMLEAIGAAEQEVLLEMYWFGSDATGHRFADALTRKAAAGVRVCVTYDAFGSFEADRAMFARMRAAGCGVFEYNPARLLHRFSFSRVNRRNHRKQLIVDGRIGFTGGVNLADPWAPEREGGLGFRDDVVRIEGPAVFSMRQIFLRTYIGPLREEALRAQLGSADSAGPCRVRVLTNQGRMLRRVIERAYLDRIRYARKRILIMNSYFIPGRLVRHALAHAVMRGVAVRVLLPVEGDVPMVTYATHRLFTWMLKHGIELYEWAPSILHSKTAVIDDDWSTVGTHNLDHRSWAYNLEINVVIEDPAFAHKLAARVQRDIDISVRVDLHTWRFRPLGERLLERLCFLFRKLL